MLDPGTDTVTDYTIDFGDGTGESKSDADPDGVHTHTFENPDPGADVEHVVAVDEVTDENGTWPVNADVTVKVRFVDRQAPDTFLVSAPEAFTTSTEATFEFRGEDDSFEPADLLFTCRLDDGEPTVETRDFDGRSVSLPTCGWDEVAGEKTFSITYTDLVEGTHEFTVAASEVNGLADGTPATFSWIVDGAPPEADVATRRRVLLDVGPWSRFFVLEGTATDDSSGVATVSVEFDMVFSDEVITVDATVTCADEARTECEWSVVPPDQRIDFADVSVTVTDRSGVSTTNDPFRVLLVSPN